MEGDQSEPKNLDKPKPESQTPPPDMESPAEALSKNTKEKNDWEETYAKRNFLLGVLTATATIVFLILAIIQIGDTKRSTQSAIDATELARKQYDMSVQAAKEDAEETRNRFKMDSANAQAQINALRDQMNLTKKQFEVAYTPYLTVTEVITDNFNPGTKFSLHYQIKNFGRYPAKITSVSSDFLMTNSMTVVKKWTDIPESIDFITHDTYLFADNTVKMSGNIIDPIRDEVLESFVEGRTSFFFRAEVIYINLITKEKMSLRYLFKITSFSKGERGMAMGTVLINDNVPIK